MYAINSNEGGYELITVLDDKKTKSKSILHKNYFEFHDMLDYLEENIPWEDPEFHFMGKSTPAPRRMCSYGATSGSMKYSHISVTTHNWNESQVGLMIKSIRSDVSKLTGIKYNSCLINYYRSGKDSISYHSDRSDLDLKKSIMTITISDGPRAFCIKNKETKIVTKAIINDGDVISMEGNLQEFYQHSVPKNVSSVRRISLTYRCV